MRRTLDRKTFFDEMDRKVMRPDDAPVVSRPSAYAIVIRDSRILFSRCARSGYLVLPGGKIEEGETLSECIAREGHEETGHRLLMVGSAPVSVIERQFYWRESDTYFMCLLLIFRAVVQEEPSADWRPSDPSEVSEALWVSFDDLRSEEINSCFVEPVRKALLELGLRLA